MDEDCDVLVVGGGLVGASLALALAGTPLRTVLVEARQADLALADPARERYLALSRASINALRRLGVWRHVDAHAQSIHAVHVSRRGDFGRLRLRANDHDVDRFGAVVPASRLGAALESALSDARTLRRLAPATLAGFDQADTGVDAGLTVAGREQRLRTRVLVGADGAGSFVRGHAGLAVERHDYGQDALVLSVAIERDHQGVAYERFTDGGAIALLPLPGRRAGLVWTLPRADAEACMALPETERMSGLQDVFGWRLGRLHSPGRTIRHPLARTWSPVVAHGRVALVGNAAQSLHPIAAQGFNLGLRDALVLAEELSGNAGAEHALLAYQSRRQADRERIAGMSHALARWPELAAPGLGLLRGLGFAGLNASTSLQRSLALAGMGYGQDMPALALEPAL